MENAASRFGQRLAHTEKKYRDQALKKLTVYLTKKGEWSDLEWDKLWKALFYCMWMSDKRPVQEELSANLAALVHKIPTPELALSFVHSFLRTMHREWHGIDGLRLDKFYSLIRKFVHESIALLRDNEWDHELVQTFVSMISSEIVSQLPNGLRMHLSDLFLEETWKAAGASVETDSFLLLLEPFFTLLSSEYDKTIFKRVRELVFAPMLSDYKFGAQPDKKKKANAAASGETDGETDGDDEDEDKVFEHVELAHVQHRIFTIASADDTAERNRSGLYDLYGKFFAVTKVDSLKAAQEEANKPKAPLKKRTKKVEAATTTEVDASAATAAGSAETPAKNKKNKKRKSAQVEAEDAAVEVPVVETPVVETKKSKKQKAAEAAESKANAAKKSVETEPVKQLKKDEAAVPVKESKKTEKKDKKAEKMAEPVKEAKKDKKAVADAAPAKQQESTPKDKKSKKEPNPEPAATASKSEETAGAAASKKEKAKAAKEPEKPKKLVVVKSGIKFQRCAVCKGFGKGFLPAGKDVCVHCERSQKSQKKAAAVVAKKRKASELAASAAAAEAETASAKKVTFGKNKALPHDLSVKRLKASAKKEATPKEETSIKGVLKASAIASSSSKKESKKAGKGRMKAADFF